jgi:hypothetical protein
MSEADSAKIPLLFPDPVIEYYLERVDRAAIRAQLKKTVEERLRWLEEQPKGTPDVPSPVAREEPDRVPVNKPKTDMGGDQAWFVETAAVPLLYPDPVIEAYLEDVDRGLIREALKLSVAERFARFERLMKSAYELRRGRV